MKKIKKNLMRTLLSSYKIQQSGIENIKSAAEVFVLLSALGMAKHPICKAELWLYVRALQL